MFRSAPEGQLPPIRVLVANLSQSVAQMVLPLIQQQPDMRCVGQVEGNLETLLAAADGVDVVVLGALRVGPSPGICSHLLNEFPNIKILVLATLDDTGMLYWLGLRHRHVDTSPMTLVNTIRRSCSHDPID